jgi:hypothetical protein
VGRASRAKVDDKEEYALLTAWVQPLIECHRTGGFFGAGRRQPPNVPDVALRQRLLSIVSCAFEPFGSQTDTRTFKLCLSLALALQCAFALKPY